MQEDERKLIGEYVRRIARGDECALNELYKSVGGRMLSVALSIVGERSAAEDILQDSFLAIVQKAGKFRYYQNGYGWVCTIVRNTALDYVRRRNRQRCENIDEAFYIADDGASVEDHATSRVSVRGAISQLEQKERTAIYYRYYEDLSVREIAHRMGLSKSAADRLLRYAEQKLRKLLE